MKTKHHGERNEHDLAEVRKRVEALNTKLRYDAFTRWIQTKQRQYVPWTQAIVMLMLGFLVFGVITLSPVGKIVENNTVQYIGFDVRLAKTTYALGERVQIAILPPDADYSIILFTPDGYSIPLQNLSVLPDVEGSYTLNILLSKEGFNDRIVKMFDVADMNTASKDVLDQITANGIPQLEPIIPLERTAKIESGEKRFPLEIGITKEPEKELPAQAQSVTQTVLPTSVGTGQTPGEKRIQIPKLNQTEDGTHFRGRGNAKISGKVQWYDYQERPLAAPEAGLASVEFVPDNVDVEYLRLDRVEIQHPNDPVVQLEDVPVSSIRNTAGIRWTKAIAFNPLANFSNGTMLLTATGDSLYKCKDYDFNKRQCRGTMDFQQWLIVGEQYSLTLTPDDPVIAEGNASSKPRSANYSDCGSCANKLTSRDATSEIQTLDSGIGINITNQEPGTTESTDWGNLNINWTPQLNMSNVNNVSFTVRWRRNGTSATGATTGNFFMWNISNNVYVNVCTGTVPNGTAWSNISCYLNTTANGKDPRASQFDNLKILLNLSTVDGSNPKNEQTDTFVDFAYMYIDYVASVYLNKTVPDNASLPFYYQNDVVNVSTQAGSDAGISSVEFNVTYPNGTKKVYSMVTITEIENRYEYNFSDTNQIGRYNYSILANDSEGGVNNTVTRYFNISEVPGNFTFVSSLLNPTWLVVINASKSSTMQILQIPKDNFTNKVSENNTYGALDAFTANANQVIVSSVNMKGSNFTLIENATSRAQVTTFQSILVAGASAFNLTTTYSFYANRIVANKTINVAGVSVGQQIKNMTIGLLGLNGNSSNQFAGNVTVFDTDEIQNDADLTSVYDALAPSFNMSFGQMMQMTGTSVTVTEYAIDGNITSDVRFEIDSGLTRGVSLTNTSVTFSVTDPARNFTQILVIDFYNETGEDLGNRSRLRYKDYVRPDNLTFTDGIKILNESGDADFVWNGQTKDGFDETEGVYVMAFTNFSGNFGVSFNFTNSTASDNITRFYPAFKIYNYTSELTPTVRIRNSSGTFVLTQNKDFTFNFEQRLGDLFCSGGACKHVVLLQYLNTFQENVKFNITSLFDAVNPIVLNVTPQGTLISLNTQQNISANVTDNLLRNLIQINLTSPNGTMQWFTLQRNSADIFSIVFNNTDQRGTYYFNINASDSFENVNATRTGYFTVDNQAPNVTSPLPPNDTVFSNGATIGINATIIDDLAIDAVQFEITYPNATQKNYTPSLGPTNVYDYNLTDTAQAGKYINRFIANDTSANRNSSISVYFNVSAGAGGDATPPNVTTIWPPYAKQFDINLTVNVSANVTDNVAVGSVELNITFPNGTKKIFTMTDPNSDSIYNVTIVGNTNDTGLYNFTILANDTSNNVNNTNGSSFNVTRGGVVNVITFSNSTISPPYLTALGDVDGDGDLDLYVGAPQNNHSLIYENNGTGITGHILFNQSLIGIGNAYGASFVDIDGDGDLDLIVDLSTGTTDSLITAYQNNGTNISQNRLFNISYSDVSNAFIAVGDVNNDGSLDLAIAADPSVNSPFIAVYKNNGTGTMTLLANLTPTASLANDITFGDINNDGVLELLFVDTSGVLWIGSWVGSPSYYTFSSVSGGGLITLADIDSDGDLDALTWVQRTGSNGTIVVLANNGTALTNTVLWNESIYKSQPDIGAAFADVDNDGDLDLALPANDVNYRTLIYENDGKNLTTNLLFNVSGKPNTYGLSFGDLDNDNDVDFVNMNGTTVTGTVTIYKNNDADVGDPNIKPTKPSSGFSGTTTGRNATITFGEGSDSETATVSLFYNIRIGTTNGSNDTMSGTYGQTNTQWFWGNGLEGNNRTFANLSNGTYFWCVQSVDNELAASSFASCRNFTIDAIAPSVFNLTPVNGTQFNETDIVNITANVTDKFSTAGIDKVKVMVTYPNGTNINYTMQNIVNDMYNYSLYAYNQTGTYNWTVLANDTSANLNNTEYATFVVLPGGIRNSTVFNRTFNGMDTINVALGDIDGDGDLDLVVEVENSTYTNLTIYQNNGTAITNTILFNITNPEINRTTKIAFGDVDNDGDLDMGVGGVNFTAIYQNNGAGFTGTRTLMNYSANNIEFGDVDRDGDLDMVMSGGGGNNSILILRNNGTGIVASDIMFNATTNDLVSVMQKIKLADVDNDGDLDLAVSDGIGIFLGSIARTLILMNDGKNITLTPLFNVTYLPSVDSLNFVDIDGDGDLDMGVGLGNDQPVIFNNNGTTVTTNLIFNDSTRINGSDALTFCDVDNDGDPDMIVGGANRVITTEGIMIFEGNGTNITSNILFNYSKEEYYPGEVLCGDIGGDADLELVFAAVDSYLASQNPNASITIFNNNDADLGDPNAVPSPPSTGFTQTVTGRNTTLSFGEGSDSETPTTGLYYNMRVGTTNGSNNTMSGKYGYSIYDNYFGNGLLGNNRTLLNLSAGTYYWCVQSIDNELAASSFSSCRNFSIDTSFPQVKNITPPKNDAPFTEYTINNSVNLTANVTDDIQVDTVRVNVTWPNGTTTFWLLKRVVNDMFGGVSNLTNASQFGRYNVTYIANDTGGNINDTERTNFTIIPPNVQTVNTFGDAAIAPYQSYNRTPLFNATLDEPGDCRMAEANKSYDDMSGNIDCTGDGTTTVKCLPVGDLTLGVHNFFVACQDLVNNKDTEVLNQNYTIEILANADCNLNETYRYVVFGNLYINDSNTTEGTAVTPFRIRNDGNTPLNVSINATDLWNNARNPTRKYEYRIDNVSSNAWTAAENDTWRPVQRNLTAANVSITRLKYPNLSNTATDAEIELNVTVPNFEEAADKTSIVDIFCLSAE